MKKQMSVYKKISCGQIWSRSSCSDFGLGSNMFGLENSNSIRFKAQIQIEPNLKYSLVQIEISNVNFDLDCNSNLNLVSAALNFFSNF